VQIAPLTVISIQNAICDWRSGATLPPDPAIKPIPCYRQSICIYLPVNNVLPFHLLRVLTRQTPVRGRHNLKNACAHVQRHRDPSQASMVSPNLVGDLSIQILKTSCSYVPDNVSRLTSPPPRPRHDGRQQQLKQSPLRDSPQSNGADPGPLVWVRVTRSGKLAPRESSGDESYWWPASVR
jgi:hypothetical protein